jgi:DNA-binding NarL/FixJ family response regulator
VIRVLIADDEALVRGGFRMILEAQSDVEVVGEAADGDEVVRLSEELHPDVVLMDIRMPGTDGLAATKRLLDREGAPRVLILTTFDLDEYVYEAMKTGASGFLLKTVPARELAAAVRGIASGNILVSPEITRRLIREFVARPRQLEASRLAPPLTNREREVLRLIAQGFSNGEIAESLSLTEATIKTHVNRILAKLGVRDRVQAVVFAYESGFVAPGQE